MRVVRWAVLAAIICFASPAEAAYEELGFTEVFTDPNEPETQADADILLLAIGEPGDGTLVFAVTVSGNSIPGAAGSIDIFLSNGFRNGWDMDGACDAVFTAGAVAGNTWYCALPYSNAGVEVGDELTGIVLRSYVGIVQDYAPAGSPALTGAGTGTYLLVGCTLVDAMACPGAAPPAPAVETVFTELPAPEWNGTFAGTNAIHTLNFTSDLANATAAFTWNATAGSAQAVLADGNGTVVFNGTLEGNGTLDHAIQNATTGPWNLTLTLQDFNGTLSFSLRAPVDAAEGEEASQTGTSTEQDGNGTADVADDGEEVPVPFVLLPSALVAVALIRRRL